MFDDNRYFDVFVEYAKAAPEDLLIRISVANRGPEAAPLHVLPTLWFRNTWSWDERRRQAGLLQGARQARGSRSCMRITPIRCSRSRWTTTTCTAMRDVPLLFTENETNNARLFGAHERLALREGRHPQLRGPAATRRP